LRRFTFSHTPSAFLRSPCPAPQPPRASTRSAKASLEGVRYRYRLEEGDTTLPRDPNKRGPFIEAEGLVLRLRGLAVNMRAATEEAKPLVPEWQRLAWKHGAKAAWTTATPDRRTARPAAAPRRSQIGGGGRAQP